MRKSVAIGAAAGLVWGAVAFLVWSGILGAYFPAQGDLTLPLAIAEILVYLPLLVAAFVLTGLGRGSSLLIELAIATILAGPILGAILAAVASALLRRR